jgi:SAM-dependent methyltransferase
MASSLLALPVRISRRLQRSRAVELGDLLLPPSGLRLGGAHFRDDRAFVESGRRDVLKLRDAFGLEPSSSVLDIGCGVGRLPIGLLAELGEPADYVGADVDSTSVSWCRKHIEAHHPGARFVRLNVANARYNRRGRPIDEGFRLPWDSTRFDVIFLYSVFSHMRSKDVRAHLHEFRRLLEPGGGVFLTAFVETGVPDEEVNPSDYGPLHWRGALHCVRYSAERFERMVDEAGLSIARSEHGTETDGQSAFYLRVRSVG